MRFLYVSGLTPIDMLKAFQPEPFSLEAFKDGPRSGPPSAVKNGVCPKWPTHVKLPEAFPKHRRPTTKTMRVARGIPSNGPEMAHMAELPRAAPKTRGSTAKNELKKALSGATPQRFPDSLPPGSRSQSWHKFNLPFEVVSNLRF